MKGKPAALLFLGVGFVLAIFAILKFLTPLLVGAEFAVALIVLGGISRGFRKS